MKQTDDEIVLKIKELDLNIIQPTTETYGNKEQGGSKIVVIGKPGCFGVGTEVLMYDGEIKTIENIEKGELLMGDDSEPRNVLDLCRNIEKMYTIRLEDGDEIIVNENHILTLKNKNTGNIIDITVKNYLPKTNVFKDQYLWFKTPIDFKHTDVEGEDLSEIGYNIVTQSISENRYVPLDKKYKVNSKSVQIKILKGMVKGLPYIYIKDKNITEIFINDYNISKDLLFLSRSLGYRTYLDKINKNNIDGFDFKYKIIFFGNILDINIHSIIDINYKNLLYKFTIEYHKEDQYYGVIIDSNHRFVLSDFSVVHNTGKCLAKGTPVLMYNGDIKPVENIKVNEQIMGDDSTPRNILSVCKGKETMYEIKQLKGDNYTVNKSHILSLKYIGDSDDKFKHNQIVDICLKDYLKLAPKYRFKLRGYKVPVEYPSQVIPYNPYYVGYFLGYNDQLPECRSPDFFIELKVFFNHHNIPFYDFDPEDLLKDFFKLSEQNDKTTKTIPKEYLINSTEIRLSLLAGILDYYGVYDKSSNGIEINIYNETLATNLQTLCRSLGFSCNIKTCYVKVQYLPKKRFKLFICGNLSNIPSKIFTFSKDLDKDVYNTSIIIKKKPVDTYYGFQIDGNHRFLLGDFTVTHNTTLIKSILYAKKHIFPVGVAMSGTEDSNDAYKQIFPSTFVYNKYDVDVVRNYIKRQKIARDYLANPWSILLLDDCTDSPSIFNEPIQQGLYKRGRHWKMLYILSLQYCMDIKPVIRTNVDGTFILRETNLKNRKLLWENYAGIIPDFSMFCDILDKITDDYTALYIHNATTSNKLEDCLFWYKAKPAPYGFKFGCPEYWAFHKDRYNPEYTDPFLSYN